MKALYLRLSPANQIATRRRHLQNLTLETWLYLLSFLLHRSVVKPCIDESCPVAWLIILNSVSPGAMSSCVVLRMN